LQLVALALEGEAATADEAARWLAALGGDDRYIVDYLVEEVLAHQPAPIQHFLLHSSVVERLHGPLCDALLEAEPGTGQALLEQVERANLFIVPLDQRRQWYRYHHLFRDLLQRQLLRDNADVIPALHQRAATWYAEQGLLDQGIEEALRGGVWELAVELMATHFSTVLRQGQWTTMRRWLAALPQERLANSPQLSILYAQMLIYTGEPSYALELLERAEDALRASEDLPGLIDALLARMNLARLQDDPEKVRAIAAQISALTTPLSRTMEMMIACNLAIASQQADEAKHAIEQLSAFLAMTSPEEALILTLLARSHLGDAYAALGEEDAARAAYQRVIDLAQGRNLFPRLRAHIGLATLAAASTAWEESSHHAQEAIALAQSSERTLYVAPALLALARVADAHKDFVTAKRLAQQSLETAHALGNARQRAQAEAWLSNAASPPSLTNIANILHALATESPFVEALTAREIEVLRLVAAGATNRQIASELVISLNTVKKHIANLLGKLDAENRTHALARARERGLI
jgi:LuxR family maltose regulon positive regulatory protein